jgi:hypothetical protein
MSFRIAGLIALFLSIALIAAGCDRPAPPQHAAAPAEAADAPAEATAEPAAAEESEAAPSRYDIYATVRLTADLGHLG